MKTETRKVLQLMLVVGILAAAVRIGVIFYHRKQAAEPKQTQEQLMNLDYYVTPKKLHAYNLPSARELTRQPVWIREGYRYSYYPYDAAHKRADLKTAAGQLGPIEKMDVKDVVSQAAPGSASEKAVLAVFEKGGKKYAVPIGTAQGEDAKIYADEIFYIQDPKELYKHWPTDAWQAIDQHHVKNGMTEMQVAFAVGMGTPHPVNGDEKTVDYPNGGNALTVTFRNGRVVDAKPGKART
jgi:hypothetical protein